MVPITTKLSIFAVEKFIILNHMKRIFKAMMAAAAVVVMTMATACSGNAVEEQVKAHNAKCPVEESANLKLVSVSIQNGKDVVYRYELNESDPAVQSVNNYKANAENISLNTLNQLKANNDPSVTGFLQACNDGGYTIVYRYVGTISGDSLDVVVTPSQVLNDSIAK